MNVTLHIREGKPREVVVDRANFLIGRGNDCGLRLECDLVSRHHCVLTIQDGLLHVRDLESLNGTGLNNGVLIGVQRLHDGDTLWVAGTAIEVHIRQNRDALSDVVRCSPNMVRPASVASGS
jgi:pSer/pThr/pTyr-binding forkhead associated (FHA) protein